VVEAARLAGVRRPILAALCLRSAREEGGDLVLKLYSGGEVRTVLRCGVQLGKGKPKRKRERR
jgi:hypothetical protein